MRPVAVPEELRAADAVLADRLGLDQLVARASFALASAARVLLGSVAGRRIVVWAGPGLNGQDGRGAVRTLTRRGAKVQVVEVGAATLPTCDLVLDCAFGTGLRRPVTPPRLSGAPLVLACDLPSGIDAVTGEVLGDALRADATVTFGALKPGLLQGIGRDRAGRVTLAPLGLEVATTCQLLDDDDLTTLAPVLHHRHKWSAAVGVLAGSPTMRGAGHLVADGALRSGAGMVRLAGESGPIEAVEVPRPPASSFSELAVVFERCRALVVGPGLGQTPGQAEGLAALLRATVQPVVLDADGLTSFGDLAAVGRALRHRANPASVVLTPHDGEVAKLTGHAPGPDRLAAARALAEATGATVLLKGPTTAVAQPTAAGGQSYLVTSGPPSLATAGTGDVLAGILGALLASPAELGDAARRAALAAQLHGAAARRGPGVGLRATDLPDLVAQVLSGADHGR